MAGDAYDTLRRFWDLQEGGDYTRVSHLFAEDAVLVDPMFGTFTGGPAITEFMERMNTEMAALGVSFRLIDLAGDDEVAWAEWEAVTAGRPRRGVGIYRVRDGRITYYRDYVQASGDER